MIFLNWEYKILVGKLCNLHKNDKRFCSNKKLSNFEGLFSKVEF